MNGSNFVATLQYPGSRSYYLTQYCDSLGERFVWRRDWSDRCGGLFRAFTFNDADVLLAKARTAPFEPGGTMLVKTIYEAEADDKNPHVEVSEAVSIDLINRRISRADQNTILKECEPQGSFYLGADKEAEWTTALLDHPQVKAINANRYDVSVWFTLRKMHK